MPKRITDSGIRNGFGYYDARANEIVLKHPFYKKTDVQDVYSWLEEADDLRKLSIGIGIMDDIPVEDNGDGLANNNRDIIFQKVVQTQKSDNEVLKNILMRLHSKSNLRNVSLKYYNFSENQELFDILLQTIAQIPLVFLDLTGCYFTDGQLVILAEAIAKTHIAHLGWPEARMSEDVIRGVAQKLADNKSVTAIYGVPNELQKIAKNNREWLFALVKTPMTISEKDTFIIKEYANSLRIAVAFEKQRIFDLEKAFEAVLI